MRSLPSALLWASPHLRGHTFQSPPSSHKYVPTQRPPQALRPDGQGVMKPAPHGPRTEPAGSDGPGVGDVSGTPTAPRHKLPCPLAQGLTCYKGGCLASKSGRRGSGPSSRPDIPTCSIVNSDLSKTDTQCRQGQAPAHLLTPTCRRPGKLGAKESSDISHVTELLSIKYKDTGN